MRRLNHAESATDSGEVLWWWEGHRLFPSFLFTVSVTCLEEVK